MAGPLSLTRTTAGAFYERGACDQPLQGSGAQQEVAGGSGGATCLVSPAPPRCQQAEAQPAAKVEEDAPR